MANLHVRINQFSRQLNPTNNPKDPFNGGLSRDSAVHLKKKSRDSAISQHTISTCSSWTSVSPSSLAMRPTFSVDSSSDGISGDVSAAIEKPLNDASAATNIESQEDPSTVLHDSIMSDPPSSSSNTTRELTTQRKKWIEETLINNEYQPYSTSARDECHEKQSSSEFASERRRWVEQTLLSKTGDYKPYSTNAREEICKHQNNNELTSERKRWIESTLLSPVRSYPRKNGGLIQGSQELHDLQQVSSSVAQRRQWLSGVVNVKSSAEVEEEVRREAKMKKEARMKAEEAMRADEEEKSWQAMIIDEEATIADTQKHLEGGENYEALVVVASEEEAMQDDFIATKEEEQEEIMIKEEAVAQHPLIISVTKKSPSILKKRVSGEVMGTDDKRKTRKLLLKGLVKIFIRKRKYSC